MKILFLVHNLGKTRHFESVIHELSRRGHTVVITAAHKRNKPLKLGPFSDDARVDVMPNPVRRLDEWEPFVRPLRQARDYLRFLDPSYAHAAKLAERARFYAPTGWANRLGPNGALGHRRPLVKAALELAEDLVPSERYYELFIRAQAPDVVLVTPLVDFGSYQTDYVKSAHRLGIPVAFMPFSWDNLTNRGLVRIAPDRVLVWNAHQQRELTTYHDVPAERVVLTGAARFDEFFAMSASTGRADFCARVGLDPSRPILLYLCSSQFVAPDEVDFVRRWACTIRAAADERLATAGILVRPHPANAEQWRQHMDLAGIANAAIWSEPPRVQADPGLYDSLFHSAAVIGLNTSAMIESAIVGRPVYTIETAEFAGGQEQTLHFHYLLARNGGPVEVAQSLEEHMRQLADALAHPGAGAERGRRFVEAFVRPRGLERPVAPIVVNEIEQLATMRKRPRRTPLWHGPARHVLLALLRRRAPRAGGRG